MFFTPPWYIRDNCVRSPNRRRGLDQVKGRAPGLSGKRSTSPATGGTGEANPLPPPPNKPSGCSASGRQAGSGGPQHGSCCPFAVDFYQAQDNHRILIKSHVYTRYIHDNMVNTVSDLNEYLHFRALAFKFRNDAFSTPAVDNACELGTLSIPGKQVCTTLAQPVVDRLESLLTVLSMSKRQFIEMAILEAMDQAENVLEAHRCEIDGVPV